MTETEVNYIVNKGHLANINSNLSDIGEKELIIIDDKTVPIPTASDSGKVVGVNEQGNFELKTIEPTITTDSTTASVTLTLANNNSYRYTLSTGLTSLTLTFPTITNKFEAEIVFISGSTATTFSTSATIKWSGDDVASNTFTPVASKTYNILFWFDGINLNAVVRGVL